jgi:putative hydrolase of the HAD superfamily
MVNVTTKPLKSRYFKGLIFDLNGTLIDLFSKTKYFQVLDKIIELFQVEPEKFKEAWGESWKKHPCGDYPSVESRFFDTLKIYHGSSLFTVPKGTMEKAIKIRTDFMERQLLEIKDNVIESFNWALEKGYKLGIITNCTIETQHFWKKHPLSEYVPNPSFSCDLHLRKPDIAIFKNECEKIGIEPEKCIYIADGDDNEFDGAKSIGMETILVKYDDKDAFRVCPFPIMEYFINSYKELPDVIDNIEIKHQKNNGA